MFCYEQRICDMKLDKWVDDDMLGWVENIDENYDENLFNDDDLKWQQMMTWFANQFNSRDEW